MNNESIKAFAFQINKLLIQFQTFAKTSEFLNIPVSTIKSWSLQKRQPKLNSIDLIADKIGCYSYELLTYKDVIHRDVHNNNSREVFIRNLNKFFIDNYCYTQLQKYKLLSNAISNDALISYLRNENYRKPSLKVLDKIADELGINTYMLIKED